jgi:translation elongation factor EF-4
MFDDPIVEEIRRYRKEHAAKYGNDIHRICEALRENQKKSKRKVVNFGPKLLSDRKNLCVAEEPGEEYTTKSENGDQKT